MIARADKAASVGNFSKYAGLYDKYTDVQAEAAGILADSLPAGGVSKILELGCGTGNYTALLKERFPGASITAMDISDAMIKVAREKAGDDKTRFLTADAEAEDFNDTYDIVTANAAFHWFCDPEKFIQKAGRSLSGRGRLVVSSFGPQTFRELKSSLSHAVGKDVSIPSDTFPSRVDIGEMLRKYFSRVDVTERLLKRRYRSLMDLLKQIKYSGTRGSRTDVEIAWTPGLLDKMEKEYQKRFGSIEATYQIFFCKGQK